MVATWSGDDIALAGDLPSKPCHGSGDYVVKRSRQYDLIAKTPVDPAPDPGVSDLTVDVGDA
jgi:hypothetical protein